MLYRVMDRAQMDLEVEAGLLADLELRWTSIETNEPDLLDDELVADLLVDEMRLRSQGRWVSGPTTLLEVLRLQHDEVRNCRVVRWLLDPMAPHGFGADSLRLVLERVNELAGQQSIEPREYPGTDQATVVVEEARGRTRADIVITGQSWLVVVEAKIASGEQENQGQRLSDLWPGATYVYLTRRGREMSTAGEEPWIRMRWGDLLGAVARAAESSGTAGSSSSDVERARRSVYDYLHGARRLAR